MSAKNWSFFSRKEEKKGRKENILDTVSLWGAMGLLWYAFISMIGEHFPTFIQVDWWVILLWLVVLWLGYEWPERYLKKLVFPCRVAGIAIPAGYILLNFGKIIDGCIQMLQKYLPYVNTYYGTRFFVTQTNSKQYAVVAFTALSMLLWWIVWMLAYSLKKRMILAVFPVLALGLELIVGLSPTGNGLLVWLFGVILLASMGGRSIVKRVAAIACAGLCLLVSGVLFGENIQSLATLEKKNEVLEWQNNLSLEEILRSLTQIDFHFDWETLTNNAPNQTGKVVLEIESDQEPISTIYLRGFYATEYQNGNWKYDDSAFKKACAEAGKSETEVAQALLQMPYERQKEYGSYGEINFELRYTGTTGDVAYITYATDFASLDEEYTILGDYLLKKSVWDGTVEFSAWNSYVNAAHWMSVNIGIDKGNSNLSQEDLPLSSYIYPSLDLSDQLEELNWMNGLADAYLEVPADAAFIEEEVEKAKTLANEDAFYYMGTNLLQTNNENYKRMLYAEAVASYLSKQMSYSQQLDTLPMGADPIEYALTESHEGYCMHFASAATLMLRELGVPARYVSGYAINPSAFVFDEKTGKHNAEVTDYMAHAWVEIYLDYIGWVPVEVTPGGNLEQLPTEDELETMEQRSEQRREELKQQEASETEDTQQDAKDSEKETSSQNDSENRTQNSSQGGLNFGFGDGSGTGEMNLWSALLPVAKGLGILVLIVGLAAVVLAVINTGLRHYEAALDSDIQKKQTRKAVKQINKRIYRKLRLRNIGNWRRMPIKLTDAAYEKALIDTFTSVEEADWLKYMEIVKKRHYSLEEITIEEMMHCYECYKKIGAFNKTLTMPWHNKR